MSDLNRRRNTTQTRRAVILGTAAVLAGLGTAYLAAWAALFVLGDTT